MRRWSIGLAMSVTGVLLAACASAPATPDGDPNAAGRSSATATASPSGPFGPGAPGIGAGGAAGICANETLAESMRRAVDGGASVVLGSGAFTGTVRTGDGEIGVPHSEVALTVESTLAGDQVASVVSAWVYGDLAAGGDAAVTGEASSLWARGGRLVAVVDPQTGSGLPGPVIRVAPVVGDDVIFSWVGCWSTQGVPAREVDGSVELFDDRGLHPAPDLELSAVALTDFRAALPTS